MAAKHWISLTVCVALVAAFALVQHHRAGRATVAKVEAAALRAAPQTDRVTVGGRTFRLSRSRSHGRELLVAASADTRGLNEFGGMARTRGRLELNWVGGDPAHQRVRFVDRAGHQIVVIGGLGETTRRAMSNLAVRLAS